jgi:hypothetical protein
MKSRALRVENQAVVDSFNTTLDKLLDASSGYYASTDKEIQETSRLFIHQHISRLDGITERLARLDPNLKLSSKLDHLFEAITGGDFESVDVARGSVGVEKYKRILLLSELLREECEKWFQSYHKDN